MIAVAVVGTLILIANLAVLGLTLKLYTEILKDSAITARHRGGGS